MIPIPAFSIAKLLAFFAIGLSIYFAYRFIDNYVDAAEQAKSDLALAREAIIQKDAAIQAAAQIAEIRQQFQDAKASLISGFQNQRQDHLNRQAELIESMGDAGRMAEISGRDNGFSQGNERLTYRAQARTDEISRRLEAQSRHESLYLAVDPVTGGNP